MNLKVILKNSAFQQVAPLVVLFAFPAAVFFASQLLRRLNLSRLIFGWYLALKMGLESLGLSWLWSGSSSESSSSSQGKKHKRKSSGSASKSKTIRTRAEQIALTKVGKENCSAYDDDDELYYPGLVNISGTYCFMNSTLQALASLTYLQPHIEAIQAKAEAFDVPTPVIDALQELFKNLNTAKPSYHSLRPHGIINALSAPPPQILGKGQTSNTNRSSSLFNSREHQDAQELFQLISECIKDEMTTVERESLRDRGIAGVLDLAKPNAKLEHEDVLEIKNNKSVFDGLTANRRSCVVCGYTEAVMHFGFDNWQLAVPRLATSCRLEDCLEDYTRLEILKDCICRKCSMLATHRRLLQELHTLQEALEPSATSVVSSSSTMPSSSPNKSKPSASKKKRYKEVKRMEQRIRNVISEGRIEEEELVEGIRLEKTVSPASTKQAMIARPPPILALHLNRSVHYGQYAAKNTIKVYFPEVLDLTPYTTSGSLSTVPTSSISTPPPASSSNQSMRPSTPTQDTYAPGFQRTIYRLAAVVCHYGQHSFGHYICYRRKPRRLNGKWVPPTLVDPLRLELEQEHDSDKNATIRKANGHAVKVANYSGSSSLGEARYFWEDHTEEEVGTGRGWLRISDDSVSECGIETVLSEGTGAFMLYYEKAVHPRPTYHSMTNGHANGAHRSEPIKIPTSRARHERGNEGYDDDGTESVTDAEGDAFSIGSEETLKPKMTVVDLNGSVGSLISEVGVGVKNVAKKDKIKDAEKLKAKAEKRGSMSMSMYVPNSSASSSFSSSGFMPRVVRSVNARSRRNTPETSSTMSSSGSPPSHSKPSGTLSIPNGSSNRSEDTEMDEATLADMTASAPSILSSPEPTTSPSKGQKRQGQGLGSKSTKVHHTPAAANVKVKAQ